MKRIFVLLFVSVFLLVSMYEIKPQALYYDDTVNVNGLRFTIENGEAVYEGYDKENLEELVIPEAVNGCPITAIGGNFSYFDTDREKITSITLPDTIKTIGSGAFRGYNITEIVIPDSVTHIEEEAFGYCHNLKQVKMSKNIQYIAQDAFVSTSFVDNSTQPIYLGRILYKVTEDATGIFKVKDGTEIIGENVFPYKSQIKEVILPKSVKIIYPAFNNSEQLERINIPAKVEHIEEGAFFGAVNLKYIDVDKRNKKYVLRNDLLIDVENDILITITCARMGKIDISNEQGIKRIGNSAFAMKSNYNIILPEGLEEIGERAFYQSGITEIDIPDGVNYIPQSAFSGTLSMIRASYNHQTVYVGNHLVRAGEDGYENGVFKVKEGTVSVSDYAFGHRDDITEIILPEGLKYVGDSAFVGCETLKKVIFPDSVEHLGEYLFAENSSLSISNIPNGLTRIPVGLFSSCDNLTSIEIPSSVRSIGKNAFTGCRSFTGVMTVPEGVEVIEQGVFSGCESLEQICLPLSINEIKEYNFSKYNSGNIEIYYEGTHQAWEKILIAQTGNESLKKADIVFGNKEYSENKIYSKGLKLILPMAVGVLTVCVLFLIIVKKKHKC